MLIYELQLLQMAFSRRNKMQIAQTTDGLRYDNAYY